MLKMQTQYKKPSYRLLQSVF